MSLAVESAYLHSNGEPPRKRPCRNQPEKSNNIHNAPGISCPRKSTTEDLARLVEKSNCVELASTFFDVYGYTIIMPNLSAFYSGSMQTDDWYDDVYYYVQLNYSGKKLTKAQRGLVRAVEEVATSKDGGLTNQQWRCLLCLNIRVGRRYESPKLKKIHRPELDHLKKLATTVLDGTQQTTVLALYKALERSAEKQ
jgi:hypothetical protein